MSTLNKYDPIEEEWKTLVVGKKGDKGDKGDPGPQGPPGEDAPTEVMVVNPHGDDADAARLPHAANYWQGSVEPNNGVAGDLLYLEDEEEED